jgi:hypothetical protein
MLLGAATSLPLQIMFLYAHDVSEVPLALNKLSFTNWALMLLLPVLSFTSWKANRSFFWLAPLGSMVVVLNNYFVASYGMDYAPEMVVMGGFLFGAFTLLPLLSIQFRSLLKNPNLRWWQPAPRMQSTKPVELYVGDHLVAETKSFDISKSGIFIESPDDWFYGLNNGTTVRLAIKDKSLNPIIVSAQIVRSENAKGHYPCGMGLRFTEPLEETP